jgi:hypothetical protein
MHLRSSYGCHIFIVGGPKLNETNAGMTYTDTIFVIILNNIALSVNILAL